MSLRKTVKRDNAHAVFSSSNGDWKWFVLKTYATAKGESKNAFGRWFCLVTSPFVGDAGEMGDTYISKVRQGGRIVAASPEWLSEYPDDRDALEQYRRAAFKSQRYCDARTGEIVDSIPLLDIAHFNEYNGALAVGQFNT